MDGQGKDLATQSALHCVRKRLPTVDQLRIDSITCASKRIGGTLREAGS
jgi:hypothetical protein